MINNVWGLFAHRSQELQEINGEERAVGRLHRWEVLVLAAIPPIAAFIGTTRFGCSIGGGDRVTVTDASALLVTVLS